MMEKLIVINPGFQATIQDLGRPAFQSDGFPVSGFIDWFSGRLANILLNNKADASEIEFSLVGPEIIFKAPSFIAITGGQCFPKLNGKLIVTNQAVRIRTGDHLKIGPIKNGRFGYLAISGGFFVKEVMGSRSTTLRLNLGGYLGRPLKKGDRLKYKNCNYLPCLAYRKINQKIINEHKILSLRILPGPQWNMFSYTDKKQFQTQLYKITDEADRMGFRIYGKSLAKKSANMLSEATVEGGIQITAGGQPIILLSDRQTTGGYPIIATVLKSDIPRLVQSQNEQLIKFSLVNLKEAQRVFIQKINTLKKIKTTISLQKFKEPIGINRPTAQRIQTLFRR